jgi:serine/threonine-protein kinase
VLPFVNLSGEQESEYFSDGITEELINALVRIPALHVAARSSSFALKGKGLDVRVLGERLRVGMLVEGSVRRAGDRLRISVQLVSVLDGYQCWSQTYDRPMTDVFALQEEIARAIASALQVQLAPPEERLLVKPSTLNIEVYDKYLRGRFHWNQRSPEGLKKSIMYFRQVLEADPNMALAYTGLADAHHMLALYGVAPPREVYPKAREAATRAIEIAPDLAEAHVSAAHVAFCYDYDWATAEREYRRALELDPRLASAHHWYAWLLTAMNRTAAAAAEVRLALTLEPLSPIIVARAGHIISYSGNLSEGEVLCRLALEISPDFPVAREVLGMNLVWQERYEEGIPLLEELAAQPGSKVVYYLAWALARAGRTAEALRLLAQIDVELTARIPPGYWVFFLVPLHAELGHTDHAFKLANRFVEERCFTAILTRADRSFAALLRDPRHDAFRRKLGLE